MNHSRNVAVILGILVLVLSSCKPKSDIFEFKDTSLRYLEFVYEDTTCASDCSREYIIMSNGITFTRTEKEIEEGKATKTIIGSIEKENARNIIDLAQDITSKSSNEGIDCKYCTLYHVFYGDNKKTKSFTTYIRSAQKSIEELQSRTLEELKGQKLLDQFFVHLVYKEPRKNTIDYHFYPDGTVLKEEFGPKNGELLSSKITEITKENLKEIKDMVGEKKYNSKENLRNCNQKGLEWGYMELSNQENYAIVFTCGFGESSEDKLYAALMKKIGVNLT